MSRDPKSNYYDAGGIEVIDIIRAKLTPEQYEGYLLGNALKYQCRMMHKHTGENIVRDAEKAANHSRWLADIYQEKKCKTKIKTKKKIVKKKKSIIKKRFSSKDQAGIKASMGRRFPQIPRK